MNKIDRLITEFCQQHQLPDFYLDMAKQWFLPLAQELVNKQKTLPLLIGINGCQGSGKSTLSELLRKLFHNVYQKSAVVLSIDDFYLTRSQRQQLANKVHPLFMTRGVPGTHDINLLNETLEGLTNFKAPIDIPRFDKACDDRHPQSSWDNISSPVDIIILEGWCIGARSQAPSQLQQATNTLESEEDKHHIWRNYSNEQLANTYTRVFEKLAFLIQLKAPNFDCVYQWRKQQEEQLRQQSTADKIMGEQQLIRFIQHYQRITEHCLETIPQFADIVFHLNEMHQITCRDNNT